MNSTYTARQPGRGGEVVFRYDAKLHGAELGQTGITSLHGEAEAAQLAETSLRARTGDVLRLAIEGQGVGVEGGRARGGGVCAEVVLRERDREGGVGGEVQRGVTLAPVLDDSDVDRSGGAGAKDISIARHVACAALQTMYTKNNTPPFTRRNPSGRYYRLRVQGFRRAARENPDLASIGWH